jgi:hypothetical protein
MPHTPLLDFLFASSATAASCPPPLPIVLIIEHRANRDEAECATHAEILRPALLVNTDDVLSQCPILVVAMHIRKCYHGGGRQNKAGTNALPENVRRQ